MWHILVADDERDVCAIVKDGLEQLPDFQVTCVNSGEEALAYLASVEKKPDLALIDLILTAYMPGLKLGEHCQKQGIHVLYTSGHLNLIDEYSQKEAPDFQFISKPFRPSQLIEKIRACFAEQNPIMAGEIKSPAQSPAKNLTNMSEITPDMNEVKGGADAEPFSEIGQPKRPGPCLLSFVDKTP